jgi:hypothetical protein
MFILDPKNNSIEIYKATINKDIENFKNKYISSEWIANTITIENYKFDTFTQKKLF